MYTWILLIVEISTPKPKLINFAKIKRKRSPERQFTLKNVLPNAFWTLCQRVFPLQNLRSVPHGKNHSGVLFSTQTPKIDLSRFGVEKSSIRKLQVYTHYVAFIAYQKSKIKYHINRIDIYNIVHVLFCIVFWALIIYQMVYMYYRHSTVCHFLYGACVNIYICYVSIYIYMC